MFDIFDYFSLVDFAWVIEYDSFPILAAFLIYFSEVNTILILLYIKIKKINPFEQLVLRVILVFHPIHFVLIEPLPYGVLNFDFICLDITYL